MSENRKSNEGENALAAIGLSAATFAALPAWSKRKTFKEVLRGALAESQVEFVSANLVRGPSNKPIWHVTINSPSTGVQTCYADFPSGTDPYNVSTLDELIGRLLAFVFED